MAEEVRRANIGCGSIQPEGWWNFDNDLESTASYWDVRRPLTGARFDDFFDYAVCSFMVQELDHHELPLALQHIRAVLKPGGVLRVLVPDLLRAVAAYQGRDETWFPQDERTCGLAAKFCTYVTWYGTVRSVFTQRYLEHQLGTAGFRAIVRCEFGETKRMCGSEITALDSRRPEALIVEGMK